MDLCMMLLDNMERMHGLEICGCKDQIETYSIVSVVVSAILAPICTSLRAMKSSMK